MPALVPNFIYCTKVGQDIFDTRLPVDFDLTLYDIGIASATVDNQTWLKIDQEPGADTQTTELKWVRSLPESDQLPRILTVQGTATIKLIRQLHEDW